MNKTFDEYLQHHLTKKQLNDVKYTLIADIAIQPNNTSAMDMLSQITQSKQFTKQLNKSPVD